LLGIERYLERHLNNARELATGYSDLAIMLLEPADDESELEHGQSCLKLSLLSMNSLLPLAKAVVGKIHACWML
jgi:hypothetical protein